MLKAEQIPDEVVEAYVDAFYGKDLTRKAAIAAAINAWPGMQVRLNYFQPTEEIILPLPQEPRDDER